MLTWNSLGDEELYRTMKAGSAENNSPRKCQKNKKIIKYFVEIIKNEVSKNSRQKTKENV